ncbi:MAG: glycan-binding surface protein [Bacteroidales bacterium]
MQKIQIKIRNWSLLFATLCVVGASVILTSCNGKEETDTSVVLNSFGPMPIARGAELKFIGRNLDRVTAVVLPNNITITTFTTKTATLITLTVPQEAMPGFVVLKTPDGDITTKTEIGFSEPISITGFTPATVKEGDEITITGDYLNLVGEVIFMDRVSVVAEDFISQSRTQIKVIVPAEAQTGKFAVSTADIDPIIVFSATSLTVTLPAFTSITPNPVKAGTNLTIAGTNLDLVKIITLGGDKTINSTDFVSHTATQIVITVPADTKDGVVTMIPASDVNVVSADELVMVVPTLSVSHVTVKNGQDITVTGTDLDLIYKVIFGGNKEGVIKAGGTSTQIIVTVPDNAITGIVTFVTRAAKEVVGPTLTVIDPGFTSFAPTSAKPSTDIIITGTDLDLVVDVVFTGDIKGTIGTRSETQMTVTVPVGAKTGKITLVAKNGTRVQSAIDITVLTNLPNFISFSEPKGTPGQILTINGTNMLLIKEIVFPGGIYATAYGVKTDAKVEVYVPMNVAMGYGQITVITYEGDQGLLPSLFFGGTDPVVDPALIITNFDDGFSQFGYWGGITATGNDPAYALDNNYMHGTSSSVSGWNWIWGCNWIAFPSVTKADHLFKMDVRLDKPFGATGVHFQMEFGGTRVDIGAMGITTPKTEGWITVTFDLATFSELPATIPSGGEWGINFNYAGGPIDITGLYVDNLRFQHK